MTLTEAFAPTYGTPKVPLAARQSLVYGFCRAQVIQRGSWPTVHEIAAHLHVRKQGAHNLIVECIARGWLPQSVLWPGQAAPAGQGNNGEPQ